MITKFPLQAFFQTCQQAWANLPDQRQPSPKAHSQAMSGKRAGKENLQTLFEVKKVPSDNQIRNLLDPIPPTEFAPQYEWIWQQLADLGVFEVYNTRLNTRLMALDGMVYHSSTEIFCDCCSQRTDRHGKTHYYHATFLPLMVQPGLEHVLPCFPEMITPQDGAEKQDCERNAGKRWLAKWSHLFTPDSITYLGDDLFSNQPFCEAILAQKQHFIMVCKPDSHVELYRWLKALTLEGHSERRWNGKHGEIWRWQWVNQVPLRAGDEALLVNWCDLQIIHQTTNEVIYHNSWVTDHELHAKSVVDVCTYGRTRWKIENEGINVLKQKGYHVEHNFGHGSRYLAQVFLVLNLLAFLLHTAMHLVDERYQFLRQALHKRVIFFEDLRALCRYFVFPDWDALWLFMIKSLDEDDMPPSIVALISN
jgi:hypothetical protein